MDERRIACAARRNGSSLREALESAGIKVEGWEYERRWRSNKKRIARGSARALLTFPNGRRFRATQHGVERWLEGKEVSRYSLEVLP